MATGIAEFLVIAIGEPLAKVLLKRYLGDDAADFSSGLSEMVKGRFSEWSDQRDAQRQFERLGERISKRVLPLFEAPSTAAHFNPEAAAYELGQTLAQHVTAEFFLERDLDPAKIARTLRTARPLPKGQLSSAETALYERALDETVRYVVELASQSTDFRREVCAAKPAAPISNGRTVRPSVGCRSAHRTKRCADGK